MDINAGFSNSVTYKNLREKPSFGALPISSKSVALKKNSDKLWHDCSYVADMIGQQTRTVVGLLENAHPKRVAFMESLASSYNSRNFMLDKKLKEDSKPLLNIYEAVQNPTHAHFNIVSKSQMPFTTLEQVFRNAQDKNSIEFVQIMQHDVLDGSKESGEHIISMLASPHREEYISSPDKYRSYMKLHSDKKDAVKTLDTMIENGSYNQNLYDAKLSVKTMMRNQNYRAVLGKDSQFIEDNYTKEGRTFLDKFCNDYLAFRKGLSEEDRADILVMYASVTPENVKTRMEIIDKFKNVYTQGYSAKSEIKTMRELFDRMDNDEYAKSFVNKALGDGIKVESMEDFNRIMDIIPSRQAEIFHKNISRIVANTNLEEREKALLENVENPTFTNPRIEKENSNSLRPKRKETYLEKLLKRAENTVNKYRYNKLMKNAGQKDEASLSVNISQAGDAKKPIDSVFVPVLEDVISTPAETKESSVNLVQKLKLLPFAKKLKVKSDVNNVIEQKLGERTLEKQQGTYSEKATMIRLKLLPNIFESISATRKEQRALGKRPRVQNGDAVELYKRVQGKNKKLVRFMLKQTDANNNRVYDVKDIISVIDNAEEKILQQKKLNPEFRAKDAKAYYDELYNSMVADSKSGYTKKI